MGAVIINFFLPHFLLHFIGLQHLTPLHDTQQELSKCVLTWVELVFTENHRIWKQSFVAQDSLNMDWGSPPLRRLVAAASAYGAGDRQKRKRSSIPDLPQLTCPPHPSPGIPLQSRQHHRNAVCLMCLVIMSVVRHRVSEWRGLSWGWDVFCLLRRKVLLEVGRGEIQAPDGGWLLISFLCQKWSSLLC